MLTIPESQPVETPIATPAAAPAVTTLGTEPPALDAAQVEGGVGGDPVAEQAPAIVDHHAALATVMPETAMDAVAARVIAAGGVDGTEFDVNGGMSAENFSAHAAGVQASLQAMADGYVTSQGFQPADVWAWAQEHRAADVRSLAVEFYHSREPVIFNQLVNEYARHSRSPAQNLDDLRSGNKTTRVNVQRDEGMVNVAGFGLVSMEAARRAGLL